MDLKNIKLDKNILVPVVVIGVLLVILIVMPKKDVASKTDGNDNGTSSEKVDVQSGVSKEVPENQVSAYIQGARADERRVLAAAETENLWASLSDQAEEEKLTPEQETDLAIERLFGLSSQGGVQEERPQPRPAASAPKPKPQPVQKPAAEPAPVPVQQPEPQPEPEPEPVRPSEPTGVFGTVASGGIVSSLGGEVNAKGVDVSTNRLVKCMFLKDEKVKDGQRVTVRLLESIIVDGNVIPANSHLSATCWIGERLDLEVTSVQVNGRVFYTLYTAFDNDGLEGLYCPDTRTGVERSLKSNSSTVIHSGGNAISSAMGSILGSAVNAGVNSVSQAAQQQRQAVDVQSGYQFYLMRKEQRY